MRKTRDTISVRTNPVTTSSGGQNGRLTGSLGGYIQVFTLAPWQSAIDQSPPLAAGLRSWCGPVVCASPKCSGSFVDLGWKTRLDRRYTPVRLALDRREHRPPSRDKPRGILMLSVKAQILRILEHAPPVVVLFSRSVSRRGASKRSVFGAVKRVFPTCSKIPKRNGPPRSLIWLIPQIRRQPAFDFGDAHALAAGVVFDLVAREAVDGEVA